MIWLAIILGLIEGLTEFLPVSSTGHLILFGDLLGFEGPSGKSFEIVIQLGAIFAVLWLFRVKIFGLVRGVLSRKAEDVRFAVGLGLAFLPAMVAGALFHKAIKSALFNPVSVSVALVVGGFIILWAEKRQHTTRYTDMQALPLSVYFKIGLCQCLAMIPGTSRSGATIIGALLLGVGRQAAAEFSFFLAIPTMMAATGFQLLSDWDELSGDGIELIAAGFVAAFLSALFIVRWAMGFISRKGFAPFAYYRIALGALMLLVYFVR